MTTTFQASRQLPARESIQQPNECMVSFGGQRSYLRVPDQISGRTSPSVASMTSEPESCIDDNHYMQDDDEVDIGEW
uniref:Uncharacterized protein n=1 Tax=Heterorhabditis bacteriophora TaxID=37862 RepID=A0A1I7XI12_HETBA